LACRPARPAVGLPGGAAAAVPAAGKPTSGGRRPRSPSTASAVARCRCPRCTARWSCWTCGRPGAGPV